MFVPDLFITNGFAKQKKHWQGKAKPTEAATEATVAAAAPTVVGEPTAETLDWLNLPLSRGSRALQG